MLASSRSFLAALPMLAALWTASNCVAWSQTSLQGFQQQRKDLKAAATPGKQTFASTCAGCHGLDARGSERAPNIADSPKVQRLADSQIFRIIENGLPGTGMPAFHSLESSQIKAVVSYLRTLQGAKKTVKLPGDPARGEKLFFGTAGCSSCHMVAGKGGFIASDLSQYGRTHAVEQIQNAVIKPTSGRDRQARLATATIRNGESYVGRVRNEDNFSLQLQTLDGAFHLIPKSDLEMLEYASQTLMPSDYGSKLSLGELNDVISYLMSAANISGSESPRKVDEGEYP